MILRFIIAIGLLISHARSTTPSELAKELEKEIPGSVQYLYRWSLMETALDAVSAVFHGQRPLPSTTADPKILGFYILSTNPEMTNAEFEHHMFRIFRKQNLLTSDWKTSVINLLSVPHWFFTELLIRRELGNTRAQAVAHLIKLVEQRKDSKFASRTDIENTATLWWLFGLPTISQLTTLEYPAESVPGTGMYMMRPETRKIALEHLSLTSMKSYREITNT